MQGVMFSDNAFLDSAVTDSGLILFGALLVLFGLTLGLIFVLRSSKYAYEALLVDLVLIVLLLIGILALDLSGATGARYTFGTFSNLSEMLSTHRWLLIQLPILLSLSSVMVLLTYRERIKDTHASAYRQMVQFSGVVSFLSILLIAIESLV
jgi:hypothetical protein